MTAYLIPFFSALMVFMSLREMGKRISVVIGWEEPCIGLELSAGIACIHFVFILLSLFLHPSDVQRILFLLHAGMCLTYLINFGFGKQRRYFSNELAFILLLLCPLIVRTMSPSVNSDSLNIYLPSVEWVVNRGLSFNPYLTGYTTMPMGVEYLFSQVHAWGGQHAVRFMDGLFGVSLLLLIHRWIGRYWPGQLKWLVFAMVLLMPGGYRFLFGSGKVDMVSTIVVLTGLIYWPFNKNSDSSTLLKPLFLFSLACAFKYTNWMLLFLPISLLMFRVYSSVGSHWRYTGLLIPMAFTLPVLIRNYLLTGNPLAPLLEDPGQFVYISSHGGLPAGPLEVLSGIFSSDTDVVGRFSLIAYDLLPFILFPAVGVFTFLVWRSKGMDIRSRSLVEFLGLSVLPFYGFVSLTVQPVRFLLPQLILALVLCLRFMWAFIPRDKINIFSLAFDRFRLVVPLLIFILIWGVEGAWFTRFYRSLGISEAEWYREMREDHAFITLAMVNEGWITSGEIIWQERPVLGLVPFRYWVMLPTDFESHKIREGRMPMPPGDFMQFCRDTSCKLFSDYDVSVVVTEGAWRLESFRKAPSDIIQY